jgi:hypothetical protein
MSRGGAGDIPLAAFTLQPLKINKLKEVCTYFLIAPQPAAGKVRATSMPGSGENKCPVNRTIFEKQKK